MKKLVLVALAVAFFAGVAVPPATADACPDICTIINGHVHCGC
jgi:hypothetical protein